jgi:CheY-like chemotaxis protein
MQKRPGLRGTLSGSFESEETMTYTVLIVDDSKLARMAIARLLKGLQPAWTRIEAANADEAVGCMAAGDIDIVLLDFNMPGSDGLALAAEIRVSRPSIPMAVISANIQDEIVARTHAVGATFLSKPVNEAAMAEFLSSTERSLQSAAK